MKKHCLIAIVLVLTLTVFTGCGSRRRDPAGKNPTDMTMAPTIAPTAAPTEATAHPTDMATVPTENTTVTENAMLPGVTDHTDSTAASDAADAFNHTEASGETTARARTAR